MTQQTTTFKNKREAMLELANVTYGNVFTYALRLMKSLTNGTIESNQYELLCGDLRMHCQQNGISTTCEYTGTSLF
jgi:hypothetical protein